MLTGLLLKESLIELDTLERLHITKIETWDVANTAAYQPNVWTALSFEVEEAEADAVAEELSRMLKSPGWYIDARRGEWVYVIFPQRVFKYQHGDQASKMEAQTHAQVIGVPPSQIDWGE
jgi:hypothetical protein